eukprot:523090_1
MESWIPHGVMDSHGLHGSSYIIKDIDCPLNYASCTTDASQIFQYVSNTFLSKQLLTADDISYGKFDNIVLHIQGDYIIPPYALKSNITSSTQFSIHRLYLHQHKLYKPRTIYPILSNTNSFFDAGSISNIKSEYQLDSSHIPTWQYTKSEQLNPKYNILLDKPVSLNITAKWYSDTD